MKRGFQIALLTARWMAGAGLKALINEHFPLYRVSLFTDADSYRQAARLTKFDHLFTLGETGIPNGTEWDEKASQEEVLSRLQEILRADDTDAGKHQPLTPRELDVLRLVTQGLLNKEIADRLEISLHTVISHRKNITAKLGIKTVSGLTIYALMHGLVE